MKSLARGFALPCIAMLLAAALPAVGRAQYSAGPYAGDQYAPRTATRSVLKSPDQVQWANFQGGPLVAGCNCSAGWGGTTQVGCSRGVCYGYDNCCCRPCLLLALKRVARMLDCLLPCNKCCAGGCFLGECCGPHLFNRGQCGGCNPSCATRFSTACPTCTTPLGSPMLSDPFIDDPTPPMPTPEPAKDVRNIYPARRSPYKVSTTEELARQQAVETSAARPAPTAHVRDKMATYSGAARSSDSAIAAERSVVRRASLDERANRSSQAEAYESQAAPSPPALLPPTIRRTAAELESANLEIPVNPLRR